MGREEGGWQLGTWGGGGGGAGDTGHFLGVEIKTKGTDKVSEALKAAGRGRGTAVAQSLGLREQPEVGMSLLG